MKTVDDENSDVELLSEDGDYSIDADFHISDEDVLKID